MANPAGYAYHQATALTAPSVSTATPIPTDPGYVHALLAPREFEGGLSPAPQDFVTEYEGVIHLNASERTNVEVDLVTTHSYGDGPVTFSSVRTISFKILANEELSFSLRDFNSRTQIPLGTFTTRDGTEVTVTQAILDEPVTIGANLRVRLTSGDLSALTGENLRVTFFQLGRESRGGTDLLSAAEYKALAPKARGFSDSAINELLSAAEGRIKEYIGDPAGTGVVEYFHVQRWTRIIDLNRPVRESDQDHVTIVLTRPYEEDETIDDEDWKFFGPSRLYKNKDWWESGFYTVTYDADSMVTLAKQCQYELVNLALVSDGLLSVEDGEYKERRNTSIAFGGVGREEKRIFDRLIAGVGKIGG